MITSTMVNTQTNAAATVVAPKLSRSASGSKPKASSSAKPKAKAMDYSKIRNLARAVHILGNDAETCTNKSTILLVGRKMEQLAKLLQVLPPDYLKRLSPQELQAKLIALLCCVRQARKLCLPVYLLVGERLVREYSQRVVLQVNGDLQMSKGFKPWTREEKKMLAVDEGLKKQILELLGLSQFHFEEEKTEKLSSGGGMRRIDSCSSLSDEQLPNLLKYVDVGMNRDPSSSAEVLLQQARQEKDRLESELSTMELNTSLFDAAGVETKLMQLELEAMGRICELVLHHYPWFAPPELSTEQQQLEGSTCSSNNRPAIPAWSRCPISQKPMTDPVIVDAPCLHTCSKKELDDWLLSENATCPVCQADLQSSHIAPNVLLRDAINDMVLFDLTSRASTASSSAAPEWCLCPVLMKPMADPIIVDAECRHTCSHAAFDQWMAASKDDQTCPVCVCPLKTTIVTPNQPLLQAIEDCNILVELRQQGGAEAARPERINDELLHDIDVIHKYCISSDLDVRVEESLKNMALMSETRYGCTELADTAGAIPAILTVLQAQATHADTVLTCIYTLGHLLEHSPARNKLAMARASGVSCLLNVVRANRGCLDLQVSCCVILWMLLKDHEGITIDFCMTDGVYVLYSVGQEALHDQQSVDQHRGPDLAKHSSEILQGVLQSVQQYLPTLFRTVICNQLDQAAVQLTACQTLYILATRKKTSHKVLVELGVMEHLQKVLQKHESNVMLAKCARTTLLLLQQRNKSAKKVMIEFPIENSSN